NVIFMLDSKITVDAFNKSSKGHSNFFFILNKFNILFSSFTNSIMSFFKRQTNFVAHFIARM
ncbi:hypothetical protein D0Y65_004827, partial [Glycine soja]